MEIALGQSNGLGSAGLPGRCARILCRDGPGTSRMEYEGSILAPGQCAMLRAKHRALGFPSLANGAHESHFRQVLATSVRLLL